MEIVLKVVDGANAGQEIKITGSKFFIGRAEDCHLRPKSDLISRHHCAIVREEGLVILRDFGSKNGSFVNGERVIGELELKSGDVLSVGHLKFEALLMPTLTGKPLPKVADVKEAVARTAQRAQSANADELDVTDWLADDPADAQASSRETQQLDLWDSTATQDTIVADPSEPSSTSATIISDANQDKKKVPGKLPPIPNSSKDSRDAASDTLRKLFKGR